MRNLVFVALVFLAGCATFNNRAGKALALVATTVDNTMQGYARYVVIAQVKEEKQAPVRDAYTRYQASMAVAEKAYVELVKTGDQNTWNAALMALQASQADLLALVNSMLKGGAK